MNEPFESKCKAIEEGLDIKTQTILKENIINRKRVADTDVGQKLIEEVEDLKQLLVAYREGELKEKIYTFSVCDNRTLHHTTATTATNGKF